jgi:hypothetical protein
MALGPTQPVKEMNKRNVPGGKRQLAHKADNFATICELTIWKNVGASVSYNSIF